VRDEKRGQRRAPVAEPGDGLDAVIRFDDNEPSTLTAEHIFVRLEARHRDDAPETELASSAREALPHHPIDDDCNTRTRMLVPAETPSRRKDDLAHVEAARAYTVAG
jgi:hypothetical protein